jgi:hypothetical protein
MAQATDFGMHCTKALSSAVERVGALVATLALLLSCATAIVMWRNRRPKGIGAPRRAPNPKLGTGVVVITLGLGVLFPLLGLSILALLAFDLAHRAAATSAWSCVMTSPLTAATPAAHSTPAAPNAGPPDRPPRRAPLPAGQRTQAASTCRTRPRQRGRRVAR